MDLISLPASSTSCRTDCEFCWLSTLESLWCLSAVCRLQGRELEHSFNIQPWWGKLYRRAVRYLSRYPSSEQRFRMTMSKAFERYMEISESASPNQTEVLNALVAEMESLGYLDDMALAKGLVNSYRRRGDSRRLMQKKLRQKGMTADVIQSVLAAEDDGDELRAARHYARKKKLGVYGNSEGDYLSRKKDLERMARRGFSYAVSLAAISNDGSDDY